MQARTQLLIYSRRMSLAVALAMFSMAAHGAPTLIDSAGFEQPRFPIDIPLNSLNTDGGAWTRYDDISTPPIEALSNQNGAFVRAGQGVAGSQGLQVSRVGGTSLWGPTQLASPVTPATSTLYINWDQRLTPGTNNPFYGMFAFNAADLITIAGLDGTTGHLIAADTNGFTLDLGYEFTAQPNTWYHFQLALHYGSHKYAILVNGTPVDSGRPFVTATDQFTDALISTFGLLDDTTITTGLSSFDNYKLTAGPEGDANGDGRVNVSDLGVLATYFGRSVGLAGPAHGDFNLDGIVNAADLNMLSANYGLGGPAAGPTLQDSLAAFPALQAQIVPEPAGATLLLLAISAGLMKRRSRA